MAARDERERSSAVIVAEYSIDGKEFVVLVFAHFARKFRSPACEIIFANSLLDKQTGALPELAENGI
jgi:hypothetical protein